MSASDSNLLCIVCPRISIVVPSFNRGERLRECLLSLSRQDYPCYEIVLVDNGSTDNTREIVGEFPEVKYVYYDAKKSSYPARNFGVRHSTGELLLFFDDDQTAPPNLLKVLAVHYVPSDPYHVYVPAEVVLDPRVPRVLREYFDLPHYDLKKKPIRVGTGCVAVPRPLFEELGGFLEDVTSGGDREFFLRASGVAAIHPPALHCLHFSRRTVGEHLARLERYGYGQCQVEQSVQRAPPRILAHLPGLIWLCTRKSVEAILVPLRHPRSEWRIRWHAHAIACLERLYYLTGIAKFRFKSKRVADLPKDHARNS